MAKQSLASQTEAWRLLQAHQSSMSGFALREAFDSDAGRFDRYQIEACGLFVDYSKHLITDATLDGLFALASVMQLEYWRERMFNGEIVNPSESRAALHVALRWLNDGPFPTPDNDVMPEVRASRVRMREIADTVRTRNWPGHTGKPIDTVVNIGIGGSDLGPAMAVRALADQPSTHSKTDGLVTTYFVSNVDSTHLSRILDRCNPQTTLFIVASKSFGTQETLLNAQSARRWLIDAHGGDESAVGRHFLALSTQLDKTAAFGIKAENVLGFWDWVGGRYSLWSPIGLSIAIALGADVFERMLAGGQSMDEHFRTAPMARNLPVVMGLLTVWYRCFWGAPTQAVLPYDFALELLPAYLQQLEMESNGKQVSRDGERLDYPTGPIIWGGPGNNGQHAFYQLLHQTPTLIPADFIVAAHSQRPLPGHEIAVLSNVIGQAEALMAGQHEAQVRQSLRGQGLDDAELSEAVPHRLMDGGKPSTMIVFDHLTPEVLGALIALYEHRVFVQSVCFGTNPFDQWGVELGKKLAAAIESELQQAIAGAGESAFEAGHDASTTGLLRRLFNMRKS